MDAQRSLMLQRGIVLYCTVFCVLLGGCTKIFDAAAYSASDIISRNAAKRLRPQHNQKKVAEPQYNHAGQKIATEKLDVVKNGGIM